METEAETGMSILEHPQAKALLQQATLSSAAVRSCEGRLTRFLERYLPLFYRQEQRENATIVIEGLLSGLERKTCQPIAREHGVQRKPIQSFVGCSTWDDEAVMGELRRHVKEKLADANAVLVIDGSGFPKKGTESCGVKRQWCGRLGKVENCQVGVFLCYASPNGHAPLDRRLYLPEEWAADEKRREKCHVPPEVVFQEKWRIGLAMVDRCRAEGLPHGWVGGDDELGRPSEFRAALRTRHERYVLDVPCNTRIRDVQAGKGRKRKAPFVAAGAGSRRASSRGAGGAAVGGTDDGGGQAQDRLQPEQRRARSDVGGISAGVRPAVSRGADASGGPRRGGTGPLRGAELGGVASSHDAGALGTLVPAAGERAVGGEKLPSGDRAADPKDLFAAAS